MAFLDQRILRRIMELGVSKSDAEKIIRGLSFVEKTRALSDLAFLQEICKTPTPAGPIPIPDPKTDSIMDTLGGSGKVKVDGDASVGESPPIDPSVGDEAGARGLNELRKISSRALGEVKKLVDYVGGMGVTVYKVLAVTLALGLMGGYGAGQIPLNSMRNSMLTQISELEEFVSGQESQLTSYQEQNQELSVRVADMEDELARQGEESLRLQGQVANLSDRVVDQESTIGLLRDSLSDAENQLQIIIEEVRVDAENDRILVVVRNPSSLNAAILCIAMYTESISYRDRSSDASMLIPGGSIVELVWSEVDASAPSGFVNEGSDYLVVVTTITGYATWHLYRAVEMTIVVSNWKINSDEVVVLVINGDLHVPFPVAKTIGISKIGSEGQGIFYNVTDPVVVEEGTLGTCYYEWNESAASAPDGFLRDDSRYLVRVTYNEEEQWYTWDERYSQVTVNSPSIEKREKPDIEKPLEW